MKRALFAAAAFSAVLLATGAEAVSTSIRFDPIKAAFSNHAGGSFVTYDPGPNQGVFADPVSISWGRQLGFDGMFGGKSGYKVDTATPPALVSVPDTPFSLGRFFHENRSLHAGTSISGVTLQVEGQISVSTNGIDFTVVSPKTFTFDIDHEETNNTAPLCCDDIVTITTSSSPETFNVDGIDYTLEVLGIFKDLASVGGGGGGSFASPENGLNERIIAARFTDVRNITIPLPAGAWLLLSGFGVAGLIKRRRRAR